MAKESTQPPKWTRHVDGYICGDVAVFPLYPGAWEIWERVQGEWRPRLGRSIYTSLQEAMEAADPRTNTEQPPDKLN